VANIKSQEKRIHRARRERLENRRRLSETKTWFRRLQAAVNSGDTEAADAEAKVLQQKVDRAVKTGAMHRNAGARKKSRAARIRASL
jgi:small subunit ribosomal protein S20